MFSTIAKKVSEYQKNNPDKKIIKLGIGDVTKPIVPAIIEAMHKAVDEMGVAESFRGYGPEQGYEFLRKAIIENEYKDLGIELDEIFVSDGTEEDRYIRKLVKAADKLSALIKCIEENAMGNREFLDAEKATRNALQKFDLPEVKVFLEEFIPSFSLTLDEQKI